MGFKTLLYTLSSNNRAVPGALQFLPLLCVEDSLPSVQLLAASLYVDTVQMDAVFLDHRNTCGSAMQLP